MTILGKTLKKRLECYRMRYKVTNLSIDDWWNGSNNNWNGWEERKKKQSDLKFSETKGLKQLWKKVHYRQKKN